MSDRRIKDPIGGPLVTFREEYNQLIDTMRALGIIVHEGDSSDLTLITTADATTTATAVSLANEIKAAANLHMADADEHIAADATNTVDDADATDQTTLDTLINNMKDDLIAHAALATSHHLAEAHGGFIAVVFDTADSTDAATSLTLVNDLKDFYNQHIQSRAQKLTT